MFCVECGKEGELVGSLCKECYARKRVHASLPDHVNVILCAHCSSTLSDDKWVDIGSVREAAEAAVKRAVELPKGIRLAQLSLSLTELDERNMDAKVTLVLESEGMTFERELATTIRLKRGSCTECSKQQGNYYEAILQLRGDDRASSEEPLSAMEKRIRDRVASMRRKDRGVFISKVLKVKGGLDFYFSTTQVAKTLAREIQESTCAEFKESSSLWGQKDGEEIYRMTFLVRLPSFGKGDIVTYSKRAYYVRGMSRGVLHGIDLANGEERPIRLKEHDECALTVSKDQVMRAVVVHESDRELQVLDPETMATVELRKPAGFVRNGEQIRLVKTNLGVFVLSDSW